MYFVDSLKLLFKLSFNDMASKVALLSNCKLTSYLASHQLYDYFGHMSDISSQILTSLSSLTRSVRGWCVNLSISLGGFNRRVNNGAA